MKKIITILFLLCIVPFAKAQKNFEGEITYRVHESKTSGKEASLKILFGHNKIKLLFKEKEDYEKEEVLILLDSGASYSVNRESKTFKKKMLAVAKPALQYQKKLYAGYSSSPFVPENNPLNSAFGGFTKASNTVFYLADSLYYNIPAAFEGNMELIAVQKNRIVLAAEISFNDSYAETTDSISKQSLVNIEAIEIRPMSINEDEFSIPADYADRNMINELPTVDPYVSDTAYIVDTTVIEYPAKKKTSNKPVKPAKPVNKVKPAAAKRKE